MNSSSSVFRTSSSSQASQDEFAVCDFVKFEVGESSLSSLEKRLLNIDISSKRFNNLTKEERNALYHLRDGPAIIIKGADKGCAVVFKIEKII